MGMTYEFKKMFAKLTPMQVAANELAEAEFSLLRAETGVEYAASLVSYNKTRITRLRTYLAAQVRAQQKEQAKEETS